MLLVKGAELAAVAGDLSLSLQGVDSLDTGFKSMRSKPDKSYWANSSTRASPTKWMPRSQSPSRLMDQAVGADRFALAIECSMIASRAATKSKTPTGSKSTNACRPAVTKSACSNLCLPRPRPLKKRSRKIRPMQEPI